MIERERVAAAGRLAGVLAVAAASVGLLVWYGSGAGSLAAALPGGPLGGRMAGMPGSVAGLADSVAALGGAWPSGLRAGTPPERPYASRAAWEEHYMYGVSALAGGWVLLRLVAHWRLDPRRVRLEPRSRGGDRGA